MLFSSFNIQQRVLYMKTCPGGQDQAWTLRKSLSRACRCASRYVISTDRERSHGHTLRVITVMQTVPNHLAGFLSVEISQR